MNAITMLKEQHLEAQTLLDRVEGASGQELRRLVGALTDALIVHMAVEEQVFYPAVRGQPTEALLARSLEEHLETKRLLLEVTRSIATAELEPLVDRLRDAVLGHVEDEEAQLFPIVEQLFAADDLEELGNEMEATAGEMLSGAPAARLTTSMHA